MTAHPVSRSPAPSSPGPAPGTPAPVPPTGTQPPASSPAAPVPRDTAPLSPKAGQRARRAITTAGGVVIGASFAFSYGNVTELGLSMGLWLPLALVLAPAVDLTVLALIWGIRYASLSGIAAARLRPARVLLVASGLATWGLNTAKAWSTGDLGMVALDSIAPALLIVWAEVGPWFLRLFVEIREREAAAVPPPVPDPVPVGPAPAVPPPSRRPSRAAPGAPSRSRSTSRPAKGTGTARRDEMAAWVLAERAAGRDPSGADLDAHFGTRDYGRRVLRELAATNGATTTDAGPAGKEGPAA